MEPRCERPTRALARRFAVEANPTRLSGGVDGAWRAGHLVLKRAGMADEANWIGDVFENLIVPPAARIARPVRSINGSWIECGYRAFTWVDGASRPGGFDD